MELFSEETRRDPYPLYAQLRPRSPVPFGNMWVLLTYEHVKRALHDHATFSSQIEDFPWLLFLDPPRHTQLRAMASRTFTSRSIAGLEARIAELSRGLLDRAGDEFDLVADFATPLPMMVIAELLGLPIDDWPKLARWSEAIVELGNLIIGGSANAFATADDEMRAYFDAHPIAMLDGLDGDERLRFCQLLLAAGTETTTNLISNAMVCVAEHGLHAVSIEEVLRMRAPVQAMFRVTREPVALGTATIPAGAMVVACIGAANRDPAQFANPDVFQLDREAGHIAFGHGIHFCLGAPLARLEARIAVGQLLERRIEVRERAWKPRAAFHVHGPASLPVQATKSTSAPTISVSL